MSLAIAAPLHSKSLSIPGALHDAADCAGLSKPQALTNPHALKQSKIPLRSLAEANDPSDRQGMLLLHLPQVRLVAKSIWDRMRFAVELDDLIGYGTIGLVRAVERFDPSRGILLKTYAEHRIRGAILDGLRGMDWLPRSARQKERQAHRETDPASSLDTDASASKGGPPKRAGQRAKNSKAPSPAAYIPRMEAVIPGGNLGDLERLAVSNTPRHSLGPDPESLYQQKERYDKLAQAILLLPRRQREIIELYYRRELSMKQIGERLRVHESRVSQLHSAALQKLRRHLSGSSDPEAAESADNRRPLEHYRRASRRRHTVCQSSSVSMPMVSRAVSAT